MDPATLAATVTSLLAPYLAKAGGAVLDRAAAAVPDALSRLWQTVTKRFESKPAASGAADDLAGHADDKDRQDAFALQLKMLLEEDREFAAALLEQVKELQGDNIGNIGQVNIKTGNVSGSTFVIGNNNDVRNS